MPAVLKGVLVPIVPDATLHVLFGRLLDDVLNDQVHPASTAMPDRLLATVDRCPMASSSGERLSKRPEGCL
jgi:hypothetical protein